MAENKLERKKEKAADFVDRYTNSTEVSSTFVDFRFTFGRLTDIIEDQAVVENHTRLTMSPQHAKLFLEIFENHLRKYEEKFGWITKPPESEIDSD